MPTKTLKIEARDLRVGDVIVNYGTVIHTEPRNGVDHRYALRWDNHNSMVWRVFDHARIMTIERTEPTVTERWLNLYVSSAGRVYAGNRNFDNPVDCRDAGESGDGFPVRITLHDGKPVAVELVTD